LDQVHSWRQQVQPRPTVSAGSAGEGVRG
jgi:hypothetical protein